jgi:hypothetical protein
MIKEAIGDHPKCHLLYFVGSGGIGKTRLLEEIRHIRSDSDTPSFNWKKIIDFYHDRFHTKQGLYQEITEQLDPGRKYFARVRDLLADLERKYQAEDRGKWLLPALNELDNNFLIEYKQLAEQERIVLTFDTVERLRVVEGSENTIQSEKDTEGIESWFSDVAPHLPNTVIVLAGRPNPEMETALIEGFKPPEWFCRKETIEKLSEAEVHEFLNLRARHYTNLASQLTPDFRQWIIEKSECLPIRVDMIVDLLAHSGNPLDLERKPLDEHLVDRLRAIPDPEGEIITHLLRARKGLDITLLRYLVKDSWSGADIQAVFDKMREFTIIKSPPDTQELFLHDEIYDIRDRYFRQETKRSTGRQGLRDEYVAYGRLADYYDDQLKRSSEKERLMINSFYYRLRSDLLAAQERFYSFIARWDQDDPKSYRPDFERRLLNEARIFFKRYADPQSDFYDDNIHTSGVSWGTFERAHRVYRIWNLLRWGENQQARDLAEKLYTSTEPNVAWEKVNDSLYQASLLPALGEAMLYTGAPARKTRSVLNQAKHFLVEWRGKNHSQVRGENKTGKGRGGKK